MESVLKAIVVASDSEYDSSGTSRNDSSDSSSTTSGESNFVFKKRRKLHRNPNFVEEVVVSYDDAEFKEDFRLDRRTCNFLIDEVVQDCVLPEHNFGREKINTVKAVLMTIWYSSNMETFREISKIFNVTKSSAHRIITKIVEYLSTNSNKYIKWPEGARKIIVNEGFRQLKGIVGIIGTLDGSHIKIKKPAKDFHIYYNRKLDFSILIQGVCDHEQRFTDLLVGEAGSIHDARMLKRSSLYDICLNGFLKNEFLLGDSAYPCLNWLILPFRDNGRLTQNNRTFNYRHAASRIKIENAFGALRGRFRKLKMFENENIVFIVHCVVAAAVLHNICIQFKDSEPAYEEQDDGNDNQDMDDAAIAYVSGITPNDHRRQQLFAEMFQL